MKEEVLCPIARRLALSLVNLFALDPEEFNKAYTDYYKHYENCEWCQTIDFYFKVRDGE